MKKYITKSRLLQFLQCSKLGWISHNKKELIPPPELSQQRIFKQGNEVGEEAHKLYPDGLLMKSKPWEVEKALKETHEALKQNKTLFEATFTYDNLLVRVDILNPTEKGWEIIEVKSSTKVEEQHELDLAIQHFVLSHLGFTLTGAKVLYINKQAESPEDLFRVWDGREAVEILRPEVFNALYQYQKLLAEKEEPECNLGEHCDDPYPCPLKAYCQKQKSIPETSVLNVPRIGPKKYDYVVLGKIDLKDLPVEDFNKPQRRMIECHRNNTRFVDSSMVFRELNKLQYPLYYLDFETEMRAIPRLKGTRPYQQVPFQFSLHIEEKNGEITWTEFLVKDGKDHRKALLEAILVMVKRKGTLVSFNAPFEVSRLEEMVAVFPEYETEIKNLVSSVFDLLSLVRSSIYDPGFNGSFSIKKVAPALLGELASYKKLEVQDGIMAQEVFDQILVEKDEVKKQGLIAGLTAYCKQDTWLMVLLMRKLRELSVEESVGVS